MKIPLMLIAVLAASGAAQAQLLVKPGVKGTLNVQYEYAASGAKQDKYEPKEWKVIRTIRMTVQLTADKQLPLSSLRPMEESQVADLRQKADRGMATHKKMQPMMSDMLKIAEKCGDDQACIEKAVQSYGEGMEITPELKSVSGDIEAMGKQGGPRYQVWKAQSQKGTYVIDEFYKGQLADASCMSKPKSRCNREEIRRGAGDIPPTPGKGNASAVLFEVDSQKKDIFMVLPVPMAALSYTRELKSDFPSETSGQSSGVIGGNLPMKPITVAIPADLRPVTGTYSLKMNGVEGEGGTLTVKWQFTAQ